MENKYEVKGVKSFRGMEGYGFNATLYRNGKKVAFVMDSAQGGEYDYEWVDYKKPRVDVPIVELQGKSTKSYKGTPEEKLFHEHCLAIPPEEKEYFKGKPEMYNMIPDSYMGQLVDEFEHKKWLKRNCKNKTLFRLVGDKEDEFRTIKHPYDEHVKKYLEDKLGKKLKVIINETL